jgi:hypothetical protein
VVYALVLAKSDRETLLVIIIMLEVAVKYVLVRFSELYEQKVEETG